MIKNEKVKMQRMQRTLAVERKARIDEFRRSEIEEHLKQKRDRVVQIEKDKAELLKKRKEASINAKRTRDKGRS